MPGQKRGLEALFTYTVTLIFLHKTIPKFNKIHNISNDDIRACIRNLNMWVQIFCYSVDPTSGSAFYFVNFYQILNILSTSKSSWILLVFQILVARLHSWKLASAGSWLLIQQILVIELIAVYSRLHIYKNLCPKSFFFLSFLEQNLFVTSIRFKFSALLKFCGCSLLHYQKSLGACTRCTRSNAGPETL